MIKTYSFALRTSDGAQTVLTPGQKPEAAIFYAVAQEAQGADFTDLADFSYGLACRDGNFQAATGWTNHPEALYSNNEGSSSYTGDRVVHLLGSGVRVTIDAWLGGGLELDVANAAGDAFLIYMVVFSGRTLEAVGGTLEVLASGGDTEVDLGWEPGLVLSLRGDHLAGLANSGWGALAANGQWAASPHAGDGNSTANAIFADDMFALRADSAINATEWAADATIDADGFTVSPVIAPPSDVEIVYVAIRDTDPAAGFAVGADTWVDDDVAHTSLGFGPEAVVTATCAQLDPSTNPAVMFGVGADSIEGDPGCVTAWTLSGGVDDPWDFRVGQAGGPYEQLWWAPRSFFGNPSGNAASEIARAEMDSFGADGFDTVMVATPHSTPIGGWPDSSWPTAPVEQMGWIAARVSADRRFRPQIYRRL